MKTITVQRTRSGRPWESSVDGWCCRHMCDTSRNVQGAGRSPATATRIALPRDLPRCDVASGVTRTALRTIENHFPVAINRTTALLSLLPTPAVADVWLVASVTSCVRMCACLCVRTLKGKRLELSTPNSIHIYSMAFGSPCFDAEVKRSKVNVTRLRKPSRSHGCHTSVLLRPCATASGVGMHVVWLLRFLVWFGISGVYILLTRNNLELTSNKIFNFYRTIRGRPIFYLMTAVTLIVVNV